MEAFLKGSEKVKGTEILYFENAELEKVKGGQSSFSTSGPLSLLYFKDYNRFVFHLNDWNYPLLRRLPIIGLDNLDANSRSYSFPGTNGFAYNLTINKQGGSFAFQNLDSILESNSRLSWRDNDSVFRKHEASPDDKLVRHLQKDTGITDVISGTIKHGVQNIKNKLKPSTKNLTSRKKALDLKNLKTKNFRRDAQSRIKKNFFESGQKQTSEFWQLRRGNKNNFVTTKYDDLRKTSDSSAPSLYLWRCEVEEAILRNKDISTQGLSSFSMALKPQGKENISQNIQESSIPLDSSVDKSQVGQGPMEAHSRRENPLEERNRGGNLIQPQPQMDVNEGMTHYSG